MSREIFQHIVYRQMQGLMFHSEMADYYNFLNLKDLKNFHECQYIEECETFRKIKNYFISNYHQILTIDNFEPAISIIPESWTKKTSMDIDKESITSLVENSFEIYLEWESTTLDYYKKQADKLFDMECYDGYSFIRELIDNVQLEKSHIENIIIDLKMVDFDITKIKGFQYRIK